MISNQQPVGVIAAGITKTQADKFSKQKKMFNLIAGHAAICLHNVRMQKSQNSLIQAERLKASSTIARKVVHEANNPLGIIKNYLKILGLKLPEKHPAQEELGIISEEIDRVGHIVRQLRDYSEPPVSVPELVDINQILTQILNLADNAILKPAMITLHFTPDSNIPKFKADKNALKQVIINLIKNAAEALAKDGNVHVSTRLCAAAELPISEKHPPAGNVEITIKDDGPGISEEIRDHLFEPFTGTKKDGHSGLGLSIVHSIIKDMEGRITCESPKDSGTVFVITLPLRSSKSASG